MRRAGRATRHARVRPGLTLAVLCLLPSLVAAQFPWPAASHEGLDLEAGRALFEKRWVGAPASTRASDGLGPLYNARSCDACHPRAGAGPALPAAGGTPGPALVLMLAPLSPRTLTAPDHPASRFGRQLQGAAVAGLEAEARVILRFEESVVEYPDGERASLRRPRFDIRTGDGAPLEAGLRLSSRLAPPLHGVGALEAVPVELVAALADPLDRDGDGVRGTMRGRFGLQGGEDSLAGQVARALALDLGLGNPLLPAPHGDCTQAQAECLARAAARPAVEPVPEGVLAKGADEDAGPLDTEVGERAFALLVDYLRALAPPMPSREAPRGRALFEVAGCAACHRPDLRAGEGRPWSDLLLHDMGEGLADFTPAGEVLPTLWRTAPLWGLGGRVGALLHDGRARTIEEAILWHGGEAESARDGFRSMPRSDRRVLIDFLSGL